MFVKKVVDCGGKFLYQSTLLKLLMCSDFIKYFIREKFIKMKCLGSMEWSEYYNNLKTGNMPVIILKSRKKESIFSDIYYSDKVMIMRNWCPDFVESISEAIKDTGFSDVDFSSPILCKRYIIFPCRSQKLLLVFTYFPLGFIFKKKTTLKDRDVKELNSYVFDNVPDAFFREIYAKETVYSDYSDISAKDVLYFKYDDSDNYVKIEKVSIPASGDNGEKIGITYTWELDTKNKDERNK